MIFATFRLILILGFRFLGVIAFCFSKKRKSIALHNLSLYFSFIKNIDKKINNKIVKKSFMSLGHSLADFLLLKFYTKKNIDKYVQIKGLEYLEQALKRNKGIIFSTAHFGSWELAAHCFALKGFKSLILYNPIKKPLWLENFVKKRREISGNCLIPKKNSLFSIYKKLRKGDMVSILIDQSCLPGDGRKINLFGYETWTHTAFIKLSLKTGAPIVPGFIFTKSLFKYEIDISEPLYPEKFVEFKDLEKQIALTSNQTLEKAICKAPELWMWQHRRFKNLFDYKASGRNS